MNIARAVNTTSRVLLLIINVLLLGGAPVSVQAPSEHIDLVPGLLAIRALRGGLGTGIPSDRILMQPGGPILEDREAAQLLAGMHPSRCSAFYDGTAMTIDCQRLDAREQEQERRLFEVTKGWLGKLAREAISNSDRQLILVTGGGEPLLARVEQVDIAARTYSIDIDGSSVGGRPPSDEERSLGVAWVLRFSGRGTY